METRTMLRAFSALTLAAALSAAPLTAEPPGLSGAEATASEQTTEVRVVNNYEGPVAVYLIDEQGTRTYLGVVNRTQFKAFAVPTGTIRLQVFPRSAPAGLGVWSPLDPGIQTRSVDLDTGRVVELWLEPSLERSLATLMTA